MSYSSSSFPGSQHRIEGSYTATLQAVCWQLDQVKAGQDFSDGTSLNSQERIDQVIIQMLPTPPPPEDVAAQFKNFVFFNPTKKNNNKNDCFYSSLAPKIQLPLLVRKRDLPSSLSEADNLVLGGVLIHWQLAIFPCSNPFFILFFFFSFWDMSHYVA